MIVSETRNALVTFDEKPQFVKSEWTPFPKFVGNLAHNYLSEPSLAWNDTIMKGCLTINRGGNVRSNTEPKESRCGQFKIGFEFII